MYVCASSVHEFYICMGCNKNNLKCFNYWIPFMASSVEQGKRPVKTVLHVLMRIHIYIWALSHHSAADLVNSLRERIQMFAFKICINHSILWWHTIYIDTIHDFSAFDLIVMRRCTLYDTSIKINIIEDFRVYMAWVMHECALQHYHNLRAFVLPPFIFLFVTTAIHAHGREWARV